MDRTTSARQAIHAIPTGTARAALESASAIDAGRARAEIERVVQQHGSKRDVQAADRNYSIAKDTLKVRRQHRDALRVELARARWSKEASNLELSQRAEQSMQADAAYERAKVMAESAEAELTRLAKLYPPPRGDAEKRCRARIRELSDYVRTRKEVHAEALVELAKYSNSTKFDELCEEDKQALHAMSQALPTLSTQIEQAERAIRREQAKLSATTAAGARAKTRLLAASLPRPAVRDVNVAPAQVQPGKHQPGPTLAAAPLGVTQREVRIAATLRELDAAPEADKAAIGQKLAELDDQLIEALARS